MMGTPQLSQKGKNHEND